MNTRSVFLIVPLWIATVSMVFPEGMLVAADGNRSKDTRAGNEKTEKCIVVDKSNFSDKYPAYPAVWFSPATGEIAPLKKRSEIPPEDKYEIWIEPRDPEFGYHPDQNPKDVGFSLLGKGDGVFQEATIPQKPKFKPTITDLMKESEGSKKLVFYCKAKKSECLIMITAMDSKKELIRFRWRLLKKPARPQKPLNR